MHRSRVLLILIVIIGGVIAFFWASSSRQEKRPNVLVLMLDTLRADHLGMNGYERDLSPLIDSFAAENLNFSYAVAPAPWTPASVASLFTGLYPSAHGMMPPNNREEAVRSSSRLSDGLLTMAEAFRAQGYYTAGVTPNPWMKVEFGFAQGFDDYVYQHRVRAEVINEEARKLLAKAKKSKKPFFLYLHYLDPHNPYDPPGDYRTMYSGPLNERHYEERQVINIGLYDGEIRYLNDELTKLFEYLKKEGLYEDLVIALMADHGEQFMEHGQQGHGHQLYNEEVHVPLVLKCDSCSGVVDTTVSLVDVYPTLLDIAGLPPLPTVQGFSLVSELDRRRSLGVISELKRKHYQKAYVAPTGDKLLLKYEGELPLVLEDPAGEAISEYHSRENYRQQTPIDDPNRSAELREEFQDLYRNILHGRLANNDGGTVEMDPDTVKELESLGYL